MGRGSLELAQTLLRVALAWHTAGSSTPKDPRVNKQSLKESSNASLPELLLLVALPPTSPLKPVQASVPKALLSIRSLLMFAMHVITVFTS